MPTIIHHPVILQPKDPVLALLLSLFPGGGQIYNGQLGMAALVILTYPLSLCFAPFHAYRSARRHNEILELLEAQAPAQLESAPQAPPQAVVTYRRLNRGNGGPETPNGGFYRAGLLAILGSVLAASAATGGLTAPLLLGATLAMFGASLSLAAARERRFLDERAAAEAQSELQAQVISLAAQRRGRLTLGQVVEATKLGLAEAEQLMESLAMAGQVDFVVEEDGGVVYEFTDLLRLGTGASLETNVEKAILTQARKSAGRLTLGELALEVGLPLRDLQSCLNRLCMDGFAREVEEGHRTVYVFPEFVPADPSRRT